MIKRIVRRRLKDLEMTAIKAAGFVPSHAFRVFVPRLFGLRIHPTATLYHGCEIRAAKNVSIGPRSSIGNDAVLDGRGGLQIGADVNLSTGVHIWTGQHDWMSPDFAYETSPVVIGDGAWLSARCTVLPGVSIGERAVVAAGAVVTKDVPAFVLVGGVPARQIGTRPATVDYQLPDRRAKAWWW